MKKFNLFRLLARLGLLGSYVVDGEGGGSNDGEGADGSDGSDDSNIGDKDIKDDELDDKKDEDSFDVKEELKQLRADNKLLKEDKQDRDNQTALDTQVKELKKVYPDFDGSKIKQKLIDMNKEKPGSGDKYNTAAGWEALHLKHFQTKPVDNDDFDPGRNSNEKFDFEDAMEKAAKGDDDAMESLLENSISTNQ